MTPSPSLTKPTEAPAMTRERLKSFFTGSIFYDVAAAHGHARPKFDGTTRGV